MPTESDIRETVQRLEEKRYFKTLVLPLFGRLAAADQQRIFRPTAGRQDRGGHQCGGDFDHHSAHPVCDRYRAGPHLPIQCAVEDAELCPSLPFPRPARTSGRAGVGGWPPASASASIPGTIISSGLFTPPRKSSARILPKSSCGCSISGSGTSRTFLSWTLLRRLPSRTASPC